MDDTVVIEDSVVSVLASDSDLVIDSDVDSVTVLDGDSLNSDIVAYASSGVYDGTISSTYVTFFDRLAPHFGLADYVMFRSGQYSYCCYWGSISYDGVFSGSGLDCVTLTVPSSGYSSGYSWVYTSDCDIDLSPGNALVYSNLGYYPALTGGISASACLLLVVIVSACFCAFLRGVLAFVYRFRGGLRSVKG